MQKPVLFLFALFYFSGAQAQHVTGARIKQAQFAIVKKTVEFLSTDTITFKHVTSHTCDACTSYDDLKKFARDNKLINAGSYVIDPLAHAPADSSDARWQKNLNQFKQLAVDKITAGGREKRKNLKGYTDYLSGLNTIVAGVKPEEIVSLQENQPKATVPVAQKIQASDTTVSAAKTAAKTGSLLSLSSVWIPYCIAGISLILLVVTWLDNSKNKRNAKSFEQDKRDLKNDLRDARASNTTLQKEKNILKEKLDNAELDLQAVEARLSNVENNKPADQAPVLPIIDEMPEQPITKPFVQKPKAAVINKKYARYADMGDGFSNEELLDKPDDETIFELTIAPNNTGEYKVISNPDAQKYALSNAQYFLGKTCRYDSFPFENASIETDAPGIVKLNGGKWTIINPAKITFS